MSIFMYTKSKQSVIRLMALVLVFALVLPVSAQAATAPVVQPRASDYLDSYNGYVYAAGNGKLQIWFSVTAKDTMDDIGCLTIQLYESSDNSTWRWIAAFNYSNHPNMMSTDKWYYSGHVERQVTPGKYYRAYITIYAGRNGAGDSRYFYTSSKLAT